MKIAIMQPYFFPYLGYFSLIKNTDFFILLDSVQFIRHGWIERNRILKPVSGIQYIAVPLKKHGMNTFIQDIQINHACNWKDKIFAQLLHYKKKAPFYQQTIEVIQKSLHIQTDSITQLNFNILKEVCAYLNIAWHGSIFSQMNLTLEPVHAPDEWALNICKALGGVQEYWNPEGGIEFFDVRKYEKENITIRFLKHRLPFYSQRRGVENFEKGLSMIDVMMFNSPEAIVSMLDDYTFLPSFPRST